MCPQIRSKQHTFLQESLSHIVRFRRLLHSEMLRRLWLNYSAHQLINMNIMNMVLFENIVRQQEQPVNINRSAWRWRRTVCVVEPAEGGEDRRAVHVERLGGQHLDGQSGIRLRSAGAAAERAVREGAGGGKLPQEVCAETVWECVSGGSRSRGSEGELEVGRDIVEHNSGHLLRRNRVEVHCKRALRVRVFSHERVWSIKHEKRGKRSHPGVGVLACQLQKIANFTGKLHQYNWPL